MTSWIDIHCHLDAPEFAQDIQSVRARAARAQVAMCVIPAVQVAHFERCRHLAHEFADAYALGIHPLLVAHAPEDALAKLDDALTRWRSDPRLVAVGEIGLDYFEPTQCRSDTLGRQHAFFNAQLKMARKHSLPVILHVRRSVDQVFKALRRIEVPGGIAHAFNGSQQQAQMFLDMGFKLGFGGALTYPRATRLRRLVATLAEDAIVMETDAPDMPPSWIYATALERQSGLVQEPNEPAQLPRIAAQVASLRGVTNACWATQTSQNAMQALPRLAALINDPM